MRILNVVLVFVVLLILYLLYSYFTQNKPLSRTHPGKASITIDENKLEKTNNVSNSTYSIWFNISDWNYRYGEEKILFRRENEDGVPAIMASLDALQNNINIELMTYSTDDMTGADLSVSEPPKPVSFSCGVDNIPLQRWVNLLISVYGRSLDVYIDGKLVRTCALPGLANVSSNKPVIITPDGGFDGFTSKFYYFTSATNPQQAWNIYKEGFGGNMLGSLLNRYRIKVLFLDNNVSKGSIEL